MLGIMNPESDDELGSEIAIVPFRLSGHILVDECDAT